MQDLLRLVKKGGKSNQKEVKKDYLERLGNEQIKKMIERGMQMPVMSL